jgi:hypothetical protein
MHVAKRFLPLVVLTLIIVVMSGCPDKGDESSSTDPAENDPPSAPHTPYPPNHATEQSIRPVLSWQCEDPELDPLTYFIILKRYYDGYEYDAIQTAKPTFALTEDLEKNRRHDWYIEVYDGNNSSVKSETWTFYTGETANNPPWIPFNPDPPDHATDVQSDDVTLSWNSYDPDEDPLVYDVWLEVHNGSGDFVVQNHPDDFYNIGRLGKSTDFRWYVIAKDDQGGSSSNYSTKWRFETEEINLPPAMPSNPTPDDDATGVPLEQILTWECSDPEGDPLVYDVWFGPPLSMILVSEGQTWSQYEPVGMVGDMEYEWWVVARDGEGNETQGPFWSFTTLNEVYTELQLLRSISYDYGFLVYSDMIKARFDRSYAPGVGINPLQPGGVTCGAYTLYWLDYEQIYFYLDSQGAQIFTPGAAYTFDVTPGGGVDLGLQVTATMPACDAYFTSPESNTSVSLDGFTVTWTSSCPGTGEVDIYVRNDMGEDIGIHIHTPNDGSYTFTPGQLDAAVGSMQIFVDLIAEEEQVITAPGYNDRSLWRSRISSTLILYAS